MSYQQLKFTGDLTAPFKPAVPVFNGTEAHLLRCCISRIMHSYTVIPKGIYTKEEEENDEEEKKIMEEL